MRSLRSISIPSTAVVGVILLVTLVGSAQGRDAMNGSELTISGDDGDQLTVNLSDNLLVVQSSKDGDLEELTLDLGSLSEIISTTVSEVVASLSDTEFEINLGQDNLIRISDADDEIEVDLDVIIDEAAAAMRAACEELEAGDWVIRDSGDDRNHAHYDDSAEDLDADLKQEIRNLQREIRRLQKEIRKVETKRTH